MIRIAKVAPFDLNEFHTFVLLTIRLEGRKRLCRGTCKSSKGAHQDILSKKDRRAYSRCSTNLVSWRDLFGTRQRHQPGGKARVSAAQLFRKEPTKPELASCDSLAPFVLTSDNVALTATMQIRNCGY